MRIGTNVTGLTWTGEFGELERILGESGAEVVEFPVQLWQRKLAGPEVLRRTKVCSLSGLIHRTDVIPESLLADPEIWKHQAGLLASKCEVAKSLKCPSFALGIDAWSPMPYDVALPIFLARVRHCADLAAGFGLSLNLEFVSPEVAKANGQTPGAQFCRSLAHARDLLHAVERDNVKLLLDIVHWHMDGAAT